MNYLGHQKYQNKQSNSTRKYRVLKVKNSPFKLKKDFKPVNVSIDDMDKFEEKELIKKKRFAKKLGTIATIG